MRSPALVRRLVLLCLPMAIPAGGALAQASDHPTRPIEALVQVSDGQPRCQPQELRLPADANVDLRIRNGGSRAVVVRVPDLFADDRVRSATGAAADGAGGYRVEAGANAQMIVKTPPQGQYRYECADTGGAGSAMSGVLTVVR
jgi:hypothetical protein